MYFNLGGFIHYNIVVKATSSFFSSGFSGFEHVFIGEIKGGEVSGFHDWVHFYQQEKDNAINYLGYLNSGEHDFNGVTLLS